MVNISFEEFQREPNFKVLNAKQVEFCKEFFEKKNLFLTGSAGTGKSFLLKTLFNYLLNKCYPFGKTSTTGVTAFAIGGQTLHSFAGIGLGEEDLRTLIKKVNQNKKAKDRILNCETLFVDEISMAKPELLDKLDKIFQNIRYSSEPFGGMQIIFSGDFLQLPPVWRGGETKEFAFESKSWQDLKIKNFLLTEIMRQKGDESFAKILEELRMGDTKSIDELKLRINYQFKEDIDPVQIFCKNVDVDTFNLAKLSKIKGDSKFYDSKDMGSPVHIDFFTKNCPAPKSLELKVGAQVMLVANLDVENGYVNGSIGKVLELIEDGVKVQFKNGTIIVTKYSWETKEPFILPNKEMIYRTVASRTQIPLRLCWSITTHKSQGATLDHAKIDMNESFGAGMVYVALSRVRSLESLSLVDFPASKVVVDPRCLQFYKNLQSV